MTYDELIDSILTAQDQMLKHGIEANSVTLNGRRYGKLIENCPPNMKPTIFGMAVKADYALPDEYDFLVQYEPPKPQTNADRIRSMTDEELAGFMRDRVGCKGCPHYPCTLNTVECLDAWLKWSQEEIRT